MRPLDRHAQLLRQHAGRAAMIEMAMGDEQLLDRHAMLGGGGLGAWARSPPASTKAPRIVLVHQISVQFCSNAVTGMMTTRSGGCGAVLMARDVAAANGRGQSLLLAGGRDTPRSAP